MKHTARHRIDMWGSCVNNVDTSSLCIVLVAITSLPFHTVLTMLPVIPNFQTNCIIVLFTGIISFGNLFANEVRIRVYNFVSKYTQNKNIVFTHLHTVQANDILTSNVAQCSQMTFSKIRTNAVGKIRTD